MTPLHWLFIVSTVLALGFTSPTRAADLSPFPELDTERTCTMPTESPECTLKTFWMCNEQNVEMCALVGISLRPDGDQKEDDGKLLGDIWLRPWTRTWSELLGVANPDTTVWELRGIREVAHNRIRGLRRAPEPVIGTYEMMIYMVEASGVVEKVSVFVEQRREKWEVLAYARWRDEESFDPCDRKKLGSLACRFLITGMRPW